MEEIIWDNANILFLLKFSPLYFRIHLFLLPIIIDVVFEGWVSLFSHHYYIYNLDLFLKKGVFFTTYILNHLFISTLLIFNILYNNIICVCVCVCMVLGLAIGHTFYLVSVSFWHDPNFICKHFLTFWPYEKFWVHVVFSLPHFGNRHLSVELCFLLLDNHIWKQK